MDPKLPDPALAAEVSKYDWQKVAPLYDQEAEKLLDSCN